MSETNAHTTTADNAAGSTLDTPPPLSAVERDAIRRVLSFLESSRQTLKALPRHRHYSIVETKLEESALWLRDRLRGVE